MIKSYWKNQPMIYNEFFRESLKLTLIRTDDKLLLKSQIICLIQWFGINPAKIAHETGQFNRNSVLKTECFF